MAGCIDEVTATVGSAAVARCTPGGKMVGRTANHQQDNTASELYSASYVHHSVALLPGLLVSPSLSVCLPTAGCTNAGVLTLSMLMTLGSRGWIRVGRWWPPTRAHLWAQSAAPRYTLVRQHIGWRPPKLVAVLSCCLFVPLLPLHFGKVACSFRMGCISRSGQINAFD